MREGEEAVRTGRMQRRRKNLLRSESSHLRGCSVARLQHLFIRTTIPASLPDSDKEPKLCARQCEPIRGGAVGASVAPDRLPAQEASGALYPIRASPGCQGIASQVGLVSDMSSSRPRVTGSAPVRNSLCLSRAILSSFAAHQLLPSSSSSLLHSHLPSLSFRPLGPFLPPLPLAYLS